MRKSLTALAAATTMVLVVGALLGSALARPYYAHPYYGYGYGYGPYYAYSAYYYGYYGPPPDSTITYTCRGLIIAYGGLSTATERLLV